MLTFWKGSDLFVPSIKNKYQFRVTVQYKNQFYSSQHIPATCNTEFVAQKLQEQLVISVKHDAYTYNVALLWDKL